jgi:hypothetical protein
VLASWTMEARKTAEKYHVNFRPWLPDVRVCRMTCDFTAHEFASFVAAEQRLPEQRRETGARSACRSRW